MKPRLQWKKEWSRLIQQGVWDVTSVREKEDVAAEARKSGKTMQFGRLHGICVEKNHELEKGHPSRKYTGRVAFLGKQVTNQFYETASFQDLGNSPATMEAARFADCVGCAPIIRVRSPMRCRHMCKLNWVVTRVGYTYYLKLNPRTDRGRSCDTPWCDWSRSFTDIQTAECSGNNIVTLA